MQQLVISIFKLRRLNIKGDRLVTVMSNIRGSQGIGQFGQDTLVHNNNIPALRGY